MDRPRCPYLEECSLAQTIGMEAARKVWESFYCRGSFARCERFRLHQSGQEVPDRLMPNGRLLDLPDDLMRRRPTGS